MSCLKLRMKAVLGADEGNRLLSWEIDSFIEATLLLHFYQVSPEELWNPSNKDFYQTPIMTKKRYNFILTKLSQDSNNPNPSHHDSWNTRDIVACQPSLVKCWSLMGAVFQEITYTAGISIISLDDEKEHLRSMEVSRQGLHRGFQRGGNPGPTIFMGINKSLGLLVAAQLQRRSESSQTCAQRTLASKA